MPVSESKDGGDSAEQIVARSRADIPARLKDKGISLNGGIGPALDALNE